MFPPARRTLLKTVASFLFSMALWMVAWIGNQSTTKAATDDPQIGQHVSVDQVSKALNDPSWVVVDTRSSDSFNGWALKGESQGGHIPGAVDFPAAWLNVEIENQNDRLKEILQSKGIAATTHVILYSTEIADRQQVSEFLRTLGYNKVYLFDLNRWIDAHQKLQQYPQYQRLVPPVIVKQLIDGQLPTTFERSKKIKFAEVSWGAPEASYDKGHVPNSFHVNTDHFEPPPSWYLGDAQVLTQFANDYGFQADDTVILSGADVTASYRLCVVLLYMGVADVRVLNGGLDAWKRAGFTVETIPHQPHNAETFGAVIPQRPDWIVDTKTVSSQRSLLKPFTLVDTRTWAEHQGKTSGYSYHRHKGRIPGSRYGQGSFRGPNSLTPYRNIDQTMRNFDEIKAVWQQSGIDTKNHLCFLCGGGWRAAEVFTFAQVGGIESCSLYSDGWIGWSNDSANPIDTGPEK